MPRILESLTMRKQEILSLIERALSGLDARITAQKGSPSGDVAAMLDESSKKFYALDESVASYLSQCPMITPASLSLVFNAGINPKVPKRFAQFARAMTAGNYKLIDLTSARGLIGARDAGGTVQRDALTYMITGHVMQDRETPNATGVSLRALDKLVGRVSPATVGTQLSRTFGANGFCTALGMTEMKGGAVQVNPRAMLCERFYTMIDKARADQLASIGGKGDE